MAFIRVKVRKNYRGEELSYGYLVENFWLKRKKRPKQKIKRYLGRIYSFEFVKNYFLDFNKLEKVSVEEILKLLIKRELKKIGFNGNGEIYKKSCFFVDLDKQKVVRSKKNIVLQLNEGFLCNYSIKNLFSYNKIFSKETGKEFAKQLKLTGIDMDEEEFYFLIDRMITQL